MTNLFEKNELNIAQENIFAGQDVSLELTEQVEEERGNIWAIAFWKQKIKKKWNSLSFGRKLSLLIIAGVSVPVIAVTQGIAQVQQGQAKNYLLEILDRDLISLQTALDNFTRELRLESDILSSLLKTRQLNPNNPAQQQQIADFLRSSLEQNPDNSFYIITNAQGATVAKFVQTLDTDFTQYPSLPTTDAEVAENLKPLSVPTGIDVSSFGIVKNALEKGEQLSGYELLTSSQLQPLGLAPQANIGLRSQQIEGLPTPKQPFPENTFDIDEGRLGLVAMSVQPIKLNNQIVGTVVLGTMVNRNSTIVDQIKEKNKVDTVTIFAQDWRVSTNVPYRDRQTRAIGTRVAREVAEKVLNQEEVFIGETNIIGIDYLTAYAPIYDHQKQFNPDAKPVGIAYVGEPATALAEATLTLLLAGYGIGAVVIIIGILVATRVTKSFAQPIQELAIFARKIGSGETGLRLETSDRTDEIGILTQEINQMVISQENNEELLRQEAKRAGILKDISISISRCENYHEIIGLAVEETRRLLETDRVIVYTFDENWQGTIIAESVAAGWPISLNAKIHDPCFADRYVEQYFQGRVKATPNIYQAGLTKCHLQQLEPFAVKSNLVAPIIVNNQLTGLFIGHQCAYFRQWQSSEIDLFAQIATQVGFALDRNELLEQQKQGEEQQRQEKEQLQRRALELLMQVDPVSRGDLTIRAQVTEDEIGTVADSYNSTIESLRKIVGKVQQAAQEVAETTNTNDDYIQSLSKRAIKQTKQVQAALNRVESMTQALAMITQNAAEAEQAAQEAAEIVTTGDAAMNRTVEGIVAIRETVAETAKKVKRLGESSQKISKVVNLINSFTDQTNLLALNASIEAAHAGEEGRGFAVVADEVRNLAQQSMEATAEIAKLVKDIQTETNEVVAAMETGTEQVVMGTKLVDETRRNLTQITLVSAKINELVEAIASTTVVQSKDSQIVRQTMAQVAKIAEENSLSATEVLDSFKELLAVSQELQTTVAKFKVG
jgi:methyl-accepting chemotaxis protein PixJ